jgi:hypothetical protein
MSSLIFSVSYFFCIFSVKMNGHGVSFPIITGYAFGASDSGISRSAAGRIGPISRPAGLNHGCKT